VFLRPIHIHADHEQSRQFDALTRTGSSTSPRSPVGSRRPLVCAWHLRRSNKLAGREHRNGPLGLLDHPVHLLHEVAARAESHGLIMTRSPRLPVARRSTLMPDHLVGDEEVRQPARRPLIPKSATSLIYAHRIAILCWSENEWTCLQGDAWTGAVRGEGGA
jgi:hypothetical protein